MINGQQDKPKSKNKILDFANKAFGDTTTQESDSTQTNQSGSKVLDFATKAMQDTPEPMFGSRNNPNAIHPPPEIDPTQNPNLSEFERAALDIAMVQNLSLGNRAAGYMPQSQLYSARNAFMQGMGDFFSGIGSFASAAWREATFKEQFAAARGDEPTNAEDEPLYKLGQSIKNGIQEIFPENPEYQQKMASKFARAAGTLSSQVAVGTLTGGSAVVATGIMASSFSGMEYEQVLEETGDDDLAFQTALLNLPINSLEAIPVLQALQRTDKLTGGLLKQTIKGASKIGVSEAVFETGQTAASNWIASNMYDETRKITDGMAEGGAMGFVLGGLLGGSAIALRGKAIDPLSTVKERAEANNAYQLAKGQLEQLDMTEQMFRRVFPEELKITNPAERFAAENKYAPQDYDVKSRALINPRTNKPKSDKPIFYHGTEADFSSFDSDFLGSNTQAGDAKLGFHFTDNEQIAKTVFGSESSVKKVTLDIQKTWKPFDFKRVYSDQDIKDEYYIMTGKKLEDAPLDVEDIVKVEPNNETTEGLVRKDISDSEFKLEYKGATIEIAYQGKPLTEGVEAKEAYIQMISRNEASKGTGKKLLKKAVKYLKENTDAEVITLFPDYGMGATKFNPEGKLEQLYASVGFRPVYRGGVSNDADSPASSMFLNLKKDAVTQIDNTEGARDLLEEVTFNIENKTGSDLTEFKREIALNPEGVKKRLKELGYDSAEFPINTTDALAANNEGTKSIKGKEIVVLDSENITIDEADSDVNSATKPLIPQETKKKGWLQKFVPYFQDKGEFDQDTRRVLRDGENLSDEFRSDIRLYANDMKSALREHYDISRLSNPFVSEKVPSADLKAIDYYMKTGEGFGNIPEPLRVPVKNLRMHIDKMTKAAIQVGLFEGEVKTAVEKNIGSYVYRTYKKHQYEEKWAEQVPANIRNSAKFWLQDQYHREGYHPSESEINEMVRQLLLTEDGPVNILSSNPEVRKRVADLKGRTQFALRDPNDPSKIVKKYDEIPKPIQELWGVETNPFINYLNSVSKIATLTQNHKTLSELKEFFGPGSGPNQLFFDPANTPAEVKTELDLRVLSKDDDIAMAPLDGMWTTPEMKQALLKMNEHMGERGTLTNLYIKGNSAAKLATTVLSPRTFVRNFIGSYLFLPAQGHIRTTDNAEAINNTLAIFRNPESPKSRAELKKLARLGVLERSPRGDEMRALIEDFKGKDPTDRNLLDNLAGGRTQGIKSLIEKGVMKASDAYQLGDTFFRMQLFYLEKNRYARKGVKVTDEQVAEIVHNVYQDYSRSSKAIRNLRKNIFLAPFITFHSEVIRTATNTARQATFEMKSKNPGVREIGYERMAGFLLFAGLGSGATAAIGQWLFGITDETLDSMREWSAPWNKNSTLVPVDVFNGGGRYVNLTYTDPYEIVKEPFYQFYRNFDKKALHDNLLQSFLKVAEPAMSPELFTKASTEALMGRTLDGRPLIRTGDSWDTQLMDRVAHVWDALEPGAVDQFNQVYEAIGDEDKWAQVQAFSALMGQNIVKVDAREQMPYAIADYQRRNRALRSSYLRTAREGSYEANLKELDRVNEEKRKNFESMVRKMNAAFQLGMTFDDIKKSMNENGMSEEDINKLWQERFEPFEVYVPED